MQFYYWCELKIMNVSWSSELWFVLHVVKACAWRWADCTDTYTDPRQQREENQRQEFAHDQGKKCRCRVRPLRLNRAEACVQKPAARYNVGEMSRGRVMAGNSQRCWVALWLLCSAELSCWPRCLAFHLCEFRQSSSTGASSAWWPAETVSPGWAARNRLPPALPTGAQTLIRVLVSKLWEAVGFSWGASLAQARAAARADVSVRVGPGADAAPLLAALSAYSAPECSEYYSVTSTSRVTKAVGFEASPGEKL